jgi:hypothetical protein
MNFPLKGGAEKTLESAQKAVEAYLKDYYRKKESVGEATEKVKVKRGMGGTGGGRWTTRANAKKASKKRRRKEDKRAAKIREAFFPLAERAGSEAVAVTFSLSEGPRGKDEFTAEWDGGKAQSRTIDDLLARLTRPMMNHRLSPVDNRTFGIQDTKVKAIRVFLRSQKAYSGKVWLLPRKRKPQAPPGFRYEKG